MGKVTEQTALASESSSQRGQYQAQEQTQSNARHVGKKSGNGDMRGSFKQRPIDKTTEMAGARDRDQGKCLQPQALLVETEKGIRAMEENLAQNTELENLNLVQEKKNYFKLRFNMPVKKLWRPQIIFKDFQAFTPVTAVCTVQNS